MRNIYVLIALFCFCLTLRAQDDHKSGCHVYVVDEAAVLKLGDRLEDACLKKLKTCPVTEFPVFMPSFEEETDTARTYKFPGLNYIITASVYSTDESLASASGADSLLLSIRVAAKAPLTDRADEFSVRRNLPRLRELRP